MKTLLLAASALAMFTAPAHAQLLGGVGQSVTGTLGGSVNSTLRGSTETLRSSTRGTLRGEASTRGSQTVDRRSGSVAVDRSVDTSLDGATSQVLGSQTGNASARFRGQSLTVDSDLDSRLAFGGSLGRADWRYGRRVGSDRAAAAT